MQSKSLFIQNLKCFFVFFLRFRAQLEIDNKPEREIKILKQVVQTYKPVSEHSFHVSVCSSCHWWNQTGNKCVSRPSVPYRPSCDNMWQCNVGQGGQPRGEGVCNPRHNPNPRCMCQVSQCVWGGVLGPARQRRRRRRDSTRPSPLRQPKKWIVQHRDCRTQLICERKTWFGVPVLIQIIHRSDIRCALTVKFLFMWSFRKTPGKRKIEKERGWMRTKCKKCFLQLSRSTNTTIWKI